MDSHYTFIMNNDAHGHGQLIYKWMNESDSGGYDGRWFN